MPIKIKPPSGGFFVEDWRKLYRCKSCLHLAVSILVGNTIILAHKVRDSRAGTAKNDDSFHIRVPRLQPNVQRDVCPPNYHWQWLDRWLLPSFPGLELLCVGVDMT